MGRKSDGLTPEQRAAQRAVERAGKPKPSGRLARDTPSVSDLSHLENRVNRGPEPCQRLRSLPIIDEVATHIKTGWPDIEVARWIQQEGYLESVRLDNLRLEVRRYRTRVLKPYQVAEEKLSEGQMQAVRQVAQGIDELRTIERNLGKYEAVLDRAYAAIAVMTTPAEALPVEAKGGSNGKGNGAAAARKPIEVPPKYREAEGLPDELARAYLMAGNFPFKQMTKAMDEITKAALRSAQIKAALGIVEMSNPMVRKDMEHESDEETLSVYTRRRFVGRADAMKVLQDPESRERVTSLFQRAVRDGLLHRDLEAGLDGHTIEAHAEHVEEAPEAPSDGPEEDDPAPSVY